MVTNINIREKISDKHCLLVDKITPEDLPIIKEWAANFYPGIYDIKLVITQVDMFDSNGKIVHTNKKALMFKVEPTGDYSDSFICSDDKYYLVFTNGVMYSAHDEKSFNEEYEIIQ